MKNIRQNLLAVLVGILLVMSVIWAGYAFLAASPSLEPEPPQAVESSPTEYSFEAVAETTIFEATRQAVEADGLAFAYKNYPGLGRLVTAIGGRSNGENGAYWQYWLNGAYAEEGADQAMARPGDRIEWKFSSSQP